MVEQADSLCDMLDDAHALWEIAQAHRNWTEQIEERFPERAEPFLTDRPVAQTVLALKRACGDLTPRRWQEIKAAFRWCCAYCGADSRLQLEHVIPVSRDGRSDWNNVVPACAECNRAKWNTRPEVWLDGNAHFSQAVALANGMGGAK